MSILKEKAEFNKLATGLLYDQSLYAPSIHCAYYSCFQLLKYIIKTRLKIDYSKQEAEINSDSRIKTHSYVRKKILDEISKIEKDPRTYSNISNKLKDLQELRVNSDYKNIQIDEEMGSRAMLYSNELRNYFKAKLL